MTKLEYAESVKNEILADYRNPFMKQREILEKYGLASSTMSKLLAAWGEPLRVPRKNSAQITKVCPKCRKKNDIKGGKFCPYCGADMRTDKELLIERLENATSLYDAIHESARDEIISVLNDAITELRKV